eukprot:2658494-Pyramimonas_sp.AAC.1
MTIARCQAGLGEERIRYSELIPGRAHRFAIKYIPEQGGQEHGKLVCYNIHHFGPSSKQVDALAARIAAENQVVAQCTERVTVIVLGDFNCTVDAPMHLHVPEMDKGLLVHGASWWLTLSDLAGLDPETPTHYIADEPKLTVLNQVSTYTPQLMILQWDLTATVLTEPERLCEAGISDHASVPITF